MKRVLGLFIFIIGLLGLILPILPGWVFIILGLRFIFPGIFRLLKIQPK